MIFCDLVDQLTTKKKQKQRMKMPLITPTFPFRQKCWLLFQPLENLWTKHLCTNSNFPQEDMIALKELLLFHTSPTHVSLESSFNKLPYPSKWSNVVILKFVAGWRIKQSNEIGRCFQRAADIRNWSTCLILIGQINNQHEFTGFPDFL